jgi:hypothetical protein
VLNGGCGSSRVRRALANPREARLKWNECVDRPLMQRAGHSFDDAKGQLCSSIFMCTTNAIKLSSLLVRLCSLDRRIRRQLRWIFLREAKPSWEQRNKSSVVTESVAKDQTFRWSQKTFTLTEGEYTDLRLRALRETSKMNQFFVFIAASSLADAQLKQNTHSKAKTSWSAIRAGFPNDGNFHNAIIRRLVRCVISPDTAIEVLAKPN